MYSLYIIIMSALLLYTIFIVTYIYYASFWRMFVNSSFVYILLCIIERFLEKSLCKNVYRYATLLYIIIFSEFSELVLLFACFQPPTASQVLHTGIAMCYDCAIYRMHYVSRHNKHLNPFSLDITLLPSCHPFV